MLGRNTLVGLDQHFAALVDQIKSQRFTTQAVVDQLHVRAALEQFETGVLKEFTENLFFSHAHCAQQNTGVQFTATVDTYEHQILGIHLEIQPRTTIRNNPRAI